MTAKNAVFAIQVGTSMTVTQLFDTGTELVDSPNACPTFLYSCDLPHENVSFQFLRFIEDKSLTDTIRSYIESKKN